MPLSVSPWGHSQLLEHARTRPRSFAAVEARQRLRDLTHAKLALEVGKVDGVNAITTADAVAAARQELLKNAARLERKSELVNCFIVFFGAFSSFAAGAAAMLLIFTG